MEERRGSEGVEEKEGAREVRRLEDRSGGVGVGSARVELDAADEARRGNGRVALSSTEASDARIGRLEDVDSREKRDARRLGGNDARELEAGVEAGVEAGAEERKGTRARITLRGER